MEIKNLKKAANRIKKAVKPSAGKKQERIILYGDSDLDGATSVIILAESIKTLGGKISDFYFPDRETEGYGITEKALKSLKKHAPGLLISLDCGIGNLKEVDLANKMGFEVIIVDHHEPLDKLPKAKIIVNPKQKSDPYPFKEFSCGGVAFKLAEVLLGNKMTESLRKNFLELAALSTIADMMPQESENKIFIEEGLASLTSSWRPGIKAFLNSKEFDECLSVNQKIYKIISILNVREIENVFPASFRLFTSTSVPEAEIIIEELLEKSKKRKQRIDEITVYIEQKLKEKDEPIIFEGGDDFDLNLISVVASRICNEYGKPVFLYKIMEKESHGTVRTPKEVNSVSLMKNCSKYLITYGGHAQASGFRLKNQNLDNFKKCLVENLKK